jgi:hypothetical protein
VRRAVVVACTLALVAACTKQDKDPIARAPERTSASEAPPSPPPTGAELPPPPPVHPAAPPRDPGPVAWTDSSAVDELVKDCTWHPEDSPGDESMMTCKGGLYGQSCAVDPCFDEDQASCKPKCEKACTSCDADCTKSCQACKKPCAEGDATCKRACAEKCATCKQSCVATKDRCATGTCGQVYKACTKRIVAEWKNGGCNKGCPAYNDCMSACEDSQYDHPCALKCRDRLKAVCPGRFYGMCIFNGMGPSEEGAP